MNDALKGFGALAVIFVSLVLLAPGLSVATAEKLEAIARLFRRHAAALQSAYQAYGETWQAGKTKGA